jgi:hypothetical protein
MTAHHLLIAFRKAFAARTKRHPITPSFRQRQLAETNKNITTIAMESSQSQPSDRLLQQAPWV